MKSLLTKLIGLAFILLFAYVGFKPLLVTIWKPPKELVTYSVAGEHDRSLTLVLAPKRKSYLVFRDGETDYVEAIRIKLRGSYGTHLFFGLWNVEGPAGGSGLFGYRLYDVGIEPVHMEIDVESKFVNGVGERQFPEEGSRKYQVILFKDGEVEFSGMWLKKISNDPGLIAWLNTTFKD